MSIKHIDKALNNYIPVPESGCWLWLGWVNRNGYGMTQVDGRQIGVHRLALINKLASQGDVDSCVSIDTGAKKALHSCDVPSCINPDHLRAGSQRDNMNDMKRRKRGHWQ